MGRERPTRLRTFTGFDVTKNETETEATLRGGVVIVAPQAGSGTAGHGVVLERAAPKGGLVGSLGDIPVHIVEPPGIGKERAYRRGFTATIDGNQGGVSIANRIHKIGTVVITRL